MDEITSQASESTSEDQDNIEEIDDDIDEPLFKVGDVVTLRSGGAWMTVAAIEINEDGAPGDDKVTCAMFVTESGGMMSWGGSSGPYLRTQKLPAAMLASVSEELVKQRVGGR